jgi:hypothetical protein
VLQAWPAIAAEPGACGGLQGRARLTASRAHRQLGLSAAIHLAASVA